LQMWIKLMSQLLICLEMSSLKIW